MGKIRKFRRTAKDSGRREHPAGSTGSGSGSASGSGRRREGSALRREIWGVILMAFAVLWFISLHSTANAPVQTGDNPAGGGNLAGGLPASGVLGAALATAGRWIFGQVVDLPVILLFSYGVLALWGTARMRFTLKVGGYLLLCAGVLVLFHLGLPINNGPEGAGSFAAQLAAGFDGQGGGVIGGIFAGLLLRYLAKTGAYVVAWAVVAVSLLIIVDHTARANLLAAARYLFRALGVGVRAVSQALVRLLAVFVQREREKPEAAATAMVTTDAQGARAGRAKVVPLGEGKAKAEKSRWEVSCEPADAGLNVVETGQPADLAGGTGHTGSGRGGARKAGEDANETGRPDLAEDFRNASQLPLLPYHAMYHLPPLSLFPRNVVAYRPKAQRNPGDQARLLEETLDSFGVKAKVIQIDQGPVVTRYELQPAPGVKVSRIVSLADDIALSLAAADVRIEAPIPGKAAVGIEVPNKEMAPVYFRDVLDAPEFMSPAHKLPLALGKDIGGSPVIADLSKMPHLLIAGATGSGKSVCVNTLIASLLFKARPNEVKLLLIDPKRVELANYDGIPHLMAPVVTDPRKAAGALRWVVEEMENRYKLFAANGVRNIEKYNELMAARQPAQGTGGRPGPEIPGQAVASGQATSAGQATSSGKTAPPGQIVPSGGEVEPDRVLPYVVVFIDELADLMMVAAADVEEAICRLAQMARAAGIHLVIATQRPSVDVITGLIKANIPSRISFAVSSQVDSRTILDMAGAERLLGKGDMLFLPISAPKPVRVQGAFIMDREVESLVEFWKKQGKPEYQEGLVQQEAGTRQEGEPDDPLFDEAVQLVIKTGQASASLLQRRFRVGYARAARLVDLMEMKGIVGPAQGSKPREVLVSDPEEDS
ncbi:MAG: DNA translocase FtsK [Syntrophothermus sp.]